MVLDSVNRSVRMRKAGWPAAAVLLTMAVAWQPAHAQLFGDNEARRAILDLRQRYQALSEEHNRTRGSLLELQNQIENLRAEQAKLRGREEQLTRDVTELQQRNRDLARAVEERSPGHSTAKASEGETDDAGASAAANSRDKAEFDAALNLFRGGSYARAQTAFRNFLKAHPRSSLKTSAQFWLGNSDYALRNYTSAMANFRSVVTQAPDHERAPEALLSIANCQVELKQNAAARTTLENLVARYPRSEAAQAGKDRLARMK